MKNIFHICLPQLKDNLNLFRHLKIALVVGTVLNLINQFNPIINLDYTQFNLIKGTITYLVPFLVSIYSAATFTNKEI
jgi:hypothetical protein